MHRRVQASELPLILGRPAARRIGPYAVLGQHFAVTVDDTAIAGYLEQALASLVTSSPATVRWAVVDRAGADADHRFAVFRDGSLLFGCDDRNHVVPLLLWWVNRIVCFETGHRVMVHAAVAAAPGGAVVLPAPQESGKTTLVAALVQDGLGYLTDEAAAFDPETGMVDAYPKWLSLKPGSWALFPHLRPVLPPDLAGFAEDQWHVVPDAVRPGAVVPSAEPAYVVAPRYRPGQSTSMEPMGRAEALSILVEEAFNLGRFGRAGFQALAGVVGRSECWRLTTGDLGEAVAAVRGVTG